VPWGIGAAEGGHKAIHPQLGTLEDFRELVAKAQDYGIEIALDIAYQCSPDHPTCANILNGLSTDLMVRSSTQKTRRKSIKIFTRLTLKLKTGKTSGRVKERRAVLD
jgi:hypothetical protein